MQQLRNPLLEAGIIEFAFPGLPNVGCAFTSALTGNLSLTEQLDAAERGKVPQTRAALLQRLQIERWSELKQVHGDGFIENPAPTPVEEAPSLEADGASTARANLALVIKTADCQPILLTNTKGTAVAALHVGWRGNVINFPASGVRAFCNAYGLHPSEVLAVRGPSLGPSAAEFVNFEREWPPKFRAWFQAETKTMHLWSLTKHQLQQVGLLPSHIFSLDLCTWSLPHVFYSYRRGHADRQGALIWLKKTH